MPRRHHHTAGDWSTVAPRLEELLLAAGVAAVPWTLALLTAKVAAERLGAAPADTGPALRAALARADGRWPGLGELPLPEPAPDDATLARCAAVLADVRLGGRGDALDHAFEHLVARAGKADKGQFFTPRHVARAIVAWLDPRPGELLLDPACGAAGFLDAARELEPGLRLVGVDVDPLALGFARLRLAAPEGVAAPGAGTAPQVDAPSGPRPPELRRGDSLREEAGLPPHAGSTTPPPLPSLDLLVTNPPFAGELRGADWPAYRLAAGRDRVERDELFLERAIGLLRPGGRLAIVLPQGVVANRARRTLRRLVLDELVGIVVVGLDRRTFLPHTGQKAVVLLGRRRAPGEPRAERVTLLVSRRGGKDGRGRLLLRDGPEGPPARVDHDLDGLAGAVRAGLRGEGGVPLAALGPDLVLSPERAPPEPRILVDGPVMGPRDLARIAAGLRLTAGSEGRPGRQVAAVPDTARAEGPYRDTPSPHTLGEVARVLSTETGVPAPGELVLDTTHLKEGFVWPPPPGEGGGSTRRRFVPGCVLVSRLRPYLRQVAWLPPALGPSLWGSPELVALDTPGEDPAWLVALLLSPAAQAALAAAQEGGTHPRVHRDVLLRLPVPAALWAEREAVGAAVRAAATASLDAWTAMRRVIG